MLKKTSVILIFSLTFISCSVLFDSYKSEIDGVYIPKNLDDAILEVDKFYSDSLKTEIKKLNESEFVGDYHFGTGLWIRNNWNLWSGSRLGRFFKRNGIKHPDDMSSIILVSYHRKLTGKEIEFKTQVAEYKQSWRESKKMYDLAKLPKKSKYPADSLEFGYTKGYWHKDKTSLLHFQTNSKTDSLWIYDYLYGWKKINQETAKKLKAPNYETDSILKVVFNK
ncbi:DUF6794 domain-containing protein [Lutibacter maritimus]|uniref:DUF6794 domain-containing protein n=1 Tax=Lutibacter maritimus TaxID=593133 RepID=A0A1I6SXQ4_9FLAO|nr:DUF6794 domain-containing protein [Lutibacter maritimus]SFS81716.1 hypothetical protein SAMN04488006_0191 [Lutibacter maritimus]